MTRRLIALLLSLLSVGVLSVTVFVGTALAACDENDPYVVFYENANYSGSTLVVCDGQNFSDLRNISPSDNECTGAGGVSFGTWNNCISSARAYQWASATRLLCIYDSALYGPPPPLWNHNGNSDDYPSLDPDNDDASSIRWENDTSSPYTC